MNFEEFAMPLLKGYIGAEAYYAGSMLKAVWDKDYKEALTMEKKLKEHISQRKRAFQMVNAHPRKTDFEAAFKGESFEQAVALQKEWHDMEKQPRTWAAKEKQIYQKGLTELLETFENGEQQERAYYLCHNVAERIYHQYPGEIKTDEEQLLKFIVESRAQTERMEAIPEIHESILSLERLNTNLAITQKENEMHKAMEERNQTE
mgnify:CR=1 FL=1